MAQRRPSPKPAPRAPAADHSLEKAHTCFRDGDYGGALAITNAILSRDPEVEAGIIGIEASLEAGHHPGLGIQDHGAHEGRRLVTVLVQDLGKVGKVLGQGYPELVHMMELGIRPR